MLTRHFDRTQSRAAQLEFQVVLLLLLTDIIYLDFAVLARFCAVENWEKKSGNEAEGRVGGKTATAIRREMSSLPTGHANPTL